MKSLIDINVLIALHDLDHLHHSIAKKWFSENATKGWASCPLIQNACLRIMNQPSYPNCQPLSVLIELFSPTFTSKHHEFWPDDLSIVDPDIFEHRHIHGHRQLTDCYLLALAVARGGRFVSFDRTIALTSVKKARAVNLVAILNS